MNEGKQAFTRSRTSFRRTLRSLYWTQKNEKYARRVEMAEFVIGIVLLIAGFALIIFA